LTTENSTHVSTTTDIPVWTTSTSDISSSVYHTTTTQLPITEYTDPQSTTEYTSDRSQIYNKYFHLIYNSFYTILILLIVFIIITLYFCRNPIKKKYS
jgi:hypothetical protein